MSTICPVSTRKRTSALRVNEYAPEMALGSLRACSPQSAADLIALSNAWRLGACGVA